MGRAYALAVCIKSGIAPEPRVVGGGLRTGCSGYQERVAQNREWLAGGLELGVSVTRSGWPRTPIGWWEPPRGPERSPRAGGPEPRVVGGGLRTGCSGYQERVAQNPHWFVGAATGSKTVPKSGWPRTAIMYTTKGIFR